MVTSGEQLKWITVNKTTYLGTVSENEGSVVIVGVQVLRRSSTIADFLKKQNLGELEIMTLSGKNHSCTEKPLTLKEVRKWDNLYAQMAYIKKCALSIWENRLFDENENSDSEDED